MYFIFCKIVPPPSPPHKRSRRRRSELIPNQFNGENGFSHGHEHKQPLRLLLSHCATNNFVTEIKKKKNPITKRNKKTKQKPTNHLCPSQTHNPNLENAPSDSRQRRRSRPSLPTTHSAPFTFCAVPENMAAPPTNVPGAARDAGPPVASSHRQHKRGLSPSSWESGTVLAQGTGHRPPLKVHHHSCIFQETGEGTLPLF